MSCKYILNGKEYTQKELLNLASAGTSLLSVRSRSNDETVEIMRKQAGDRFVNLDLFTPYQENVYISSISTDIISQLGTLKPGEEIKLSPSEAFLKTKAKFENSYKVYEYLETRLDTNAKITEAKKVQAYLDKFPQLNYVNTVDDIIEKKNTFKNIVDNFDRFKVKVKINLRNFGLKLVEGSNKFEELKLDKEYYESLINQEVSDDEISVEEREIRENYEDGGYMMTNPRDTASTRVKLFFATIPSTTINSLGLREFISYDEVIESFLQIGSDLLDLNYDNLQQALIEKSKFRPYLKNVSEKLGELKSSRNTSLLNEILTFANKAFQEQMLVLYEKTATGLSVEVINSNRDSITRQIYTDWLENQKVSDIVKIENDQIVINADKAKDLKKDLAVANEGSLEDKKAFVKNFMKTIGIDFTDNMIDDLEDRANKGLLKRNLLNKDFVSLFKDGNLFSILVQKYNTPPSGKAEVGYEDVNNAMKDESTSFMTFAEIYRDHSMDRYKTGSFKNGENKSIYSFINPSFLEIIKKKLKNSPEFLKKLKRRSFSSISNAINSFIKSKENKTNAFVLDFDYYDSLKEKNSKRDGVIRKRQSPKEQTVDGYIKHQNSAKSIGHYNIFTLSDKTVTPVSRITKYTLNDPAQNRAGKDIVFKQYTGGPLQDSFILGDTLKSQIYNLAESEIKRIVDYAREIRVENNSNIANFDKAFELFYLFPILNKGKNDPDGERMETIRNKMYQGEMPDSKDVEYIKDTLESTFKNLVIDELRTLVKDGVVSVQKDPNSPGYNFTSSLFDNAYMSQPQINGLTSMQKMIYTVADFKFNYLRAQITALQVFGADPVLYYKAPSTVSKDKLADFTKLSLSEKMAVVKSTMDEFSKRAAMFIAPGSQGVWVWDDQNGNLVDRTSYNAITIADVIKDTELFKEIESTDAQEFITLQEYIDRMMSEGRIPPSIWQSITNKINRKQDYFELSSDEKKFIYQPTKPVHTNSKDILGGTFTRVDYVKSSAYPLIPEVVSGTSLDDLRKFMEKNNIQSANFKSAKKTGQPGSILQVFGENDTFIEPNLSDLKRSLQKLDREGLHTQQEIPAQKEEISNISQMNRTLFDGLLDVKDFELENTTFNGREFKNLKENIRVALFDKAKNEFMQRFGVKEGGPSGVKIVNKKAFEKLLIEEAIERGFSINDISAIKIDKDGELIIPPYLMARADKFEGLINALLSKIVRLKNPGTSLVQVSGVATKLKMNELTKETKNEIIWLPNYDFTKGLQYMRRDPGTVTKSGKVIPGKVKPAQVIVSQYIRDEEGNLIDLSKFVKKDKKTGLNMLDTSSFSPELFQLVASRIPNQSLPSTLAIEVVGFLPSYMENTIVVPDGITKQMGSDFDVDKLYAYLSSLKLNYSKETEAKIVELEKKVLNAKEETAKKNMSLFEGFLSKEDLKVIKDLKEAKNKIVSKLKWNISQKEKVRKQKTIDNLNSLIEATYENVKEKNADEYLKLRQRQELNNRALEKEISSIKKEIAAAKSEGIVGATKLEYNLSDYDGSWSSLSELTEDQLNQMYRDLHWSVLTHPETFEKITKSIDFKDIKEEAALLEKEGLIGTYSEDYVPMDFREQIQIFNDNKSGKVGTGVFASLGSFLADNQDKTITLGYVNNKGEKVPAPVKVLDEDGNDLDLYKVTQAGSIGSGDDLRTKGDNNSILLSESVDNAKNKNLYKFDWGEDNMSALQAIVSLSSENDEILRINFATRFFKQNIIKEYVNKLQIARDSFADFVSDVKKVTADEILKKYYGMMSEDFLQELKKQSESEEGYIAEKFNAKKLLKLLKDGLKVDGYMDVLKDPTSSLENIKTAQDFINEYAKNQIDLFNLYLRFTEIGSEISTVIGASYFYTKGVGSSIFDVLDGVRKVGKLIGSSIFLGLDQLAGPIGIDTANGQAYLVNPQGEIGHSIEMSLMLATKLYKELYPMHFSPMFLKTSEKVFNGLSIDTRLVSSARYVKINKQIIKGLRSFLFSSPSLEITDEISQERERLLVDSETNKSLATRIEEAMETFPELKQNYFLKSLSFKKSDSKKGIAQIYYKNPFGNIDELENNKGFLSLIFSGEESLINIAKDLASYAYITGGNETNSSFGKFIPVEYFISDADFIKGIKGLKNFSFKLGEINRFYTQLVQNNPDLATKMDVKFFNTFKDVNTEEFSLDYTNELAESIMIKATTEEILSKLAVDGKKFPDFLAYKVPVKNGITYLYKRVSGPSVGVYKRINTLGTRKAGFSEYYLGADEVSTIIPDNMTKEQKKNLGIGVNTEQNVDDVDLDSLSEGYIDDLDLDFLDEPNFEDGVDLDNFDEQGNSRKGLTEEELKNPANYTGHSGGAPKADSVFDEMGKRYGLTNFKHYYDSSSKRKPPLGNTPLSKEEMTEGIEKVKVAYKQMVRPDKEEFYSLHGRNWFQVKNADAIFAVSDLVGPGEMGRKGFTNRSAQTNVEGGTGYAVQMAINEGKPVYVFHQNLALSDKYPDIGWYEYDYNSRDFVRIKTPKLTPNFAGIGSSTDLTEEGVEAIEDLYKNTFGKLADIEASETPAASKGVQVEYTPVGKTKQVYTVIGNKIFNSKGQEVFKEDSKDRNKISANLAVLEGRAVVVEHKGKRYVVNDRNQIMSVTTGDIMKWGPENGDRKAIIALADAQRQPINTGENVSDNIIKGSIALNIIEQWVQDGTATTTIRNNTYHNSFYKGDGVYRSDAGNLVEIAYKGLVKLEGNKIVGKNIAYTLDEFGKAEGFGSWKGFVAGAKYAGVSLQKGESVHLYEIKPYLSVATDTSVIEQDLIDNNLEVTSEPEDLIDQIDPNDLINMDEFDPNEIDISSLDDQSTPSSNFTQVDSEISNIIPDQVGVNDMKTVLNNIFKNTSNPFYKQLIQILANSGATKDVIVLIDNSLQDPGIYNPGVIRINTNLAKSDNPKLSVQENIENVIMHEVMHSYTSDIISKFKKDPKSLNSKQALFAKALTNMFVDLQKKMLQSKEHGVALANVISKMSGDEGVALSPKEKSLYYGLLNVDEFISMIMTDREFQQFMNKTLYKDSENQSILDRFKELLSKLFEALAESLGIKIENKSVLKNGIDNIVGMISESNEQEFTSDDDTNGDSDEGSFDINSIDVKDLKEYDLLTPAGIFEANEDQKKAIDKVSEFLNKPITDKLEDNVFLLYGPGGTGKTAALATAIRKAKANLKNKRVAYSALSHTAKGELIRAGNESAVTFASLIGSEPVILASGEEDFKLVDLSEYTKKDYPRPFPPIFISDIIVIDEASMIGDREIKAIKQRLKERSNEFGDSKVKILFMGDYAQIPPIGTEEDKDGWAIDYRKNAEKSIGLTKVERTKNKDITDVGFKFRRAIDFYNEGIEKGVSSSRSNLKSTNILTSDSKVSSENVLYTESHDSFISKYVNALRNDPFNSRNAVMIAYNNENHPNVVKLTDKIRKILFGQAAEKNLWIPGEPIFVKETFTYKNTEVSKNSRMILKSIKPTTKTVNFGTKASPENYNIPGYEVEAYYGDKIVSFYKIDEEFSKNINNSARYSKERSGYIMPDGTVFKYKYKKSLSLKGIVDFSHGYIMSAHKVQGQTYNHSFVHDMNISYFVRAGQDGKMILTPKSYAQIMYTAVSRAREKVYILTNNVKDEKGTFIEPAFKNPMKSPLSQDNTVLAAEFPSELELENQCKL